MVVCQGKSVLKGIAIGKIYLYEKQEYVLEQKQVADAEAEVARFEAAKETAIGQLDDLYEKALAEAGEEQAMIFDAPVTMTRPLCFASSATAACFFAESIMLPAGVPIV